MSAHGTVADMVRQPLESLAVEDGAIAIRLGESTVLRVEAPQALRVDVTERGEELGLDLDHARGVTKNSTAWRRRSFNQQDKCLTAGGNRCKLHRK